VNKLKGAGKPAPFFLQNSTLGIFYIQSASVLDMQYLFFIVEQ